MSSLLTLSNVIRFTRSIIKGEFKIRKGQHGKNRIPTDPNVFLFSLFKRHGRVKMIGMND